MICPNCESTDVIEIMETSSFDYGTDEVIAIQVIQPVMACGACAQCFTDYRGEDARDEAVERYRRVMGAGEVKRLTRELSDAETQAQYFNDQLYRLSVAVKQSGESAETVVNKAIELLNEAQKKIRSYENWERSINEALNSGDGSYRP